MDTDYDQVVAQLHGQIAHLRAALTTLMQGLAALDRLGPRVAIAASPAHADAAPVAPAADGSRLCRWCGKACIAKGVGAHERTCPKNPKPPTSPCQKGCGRTFTHGPSRVVHEAACAGPDTTPAPPAPAPPAPVELGEARAATARAGLIGTPPTRPTPPARPAPPRPGHFECDDCGHRTDTLDALDAHADDAHDRDLRPAERHRVIWAAS